MHDSAMSMRDTGPFTILKSSIRFALNVRRRASNVQKGLNIYPRLNVLFVHIPKTAGMSVHATLAAADSALGHTSLYSYDLEKLLYTHPGNQHLKAYQWRRVIGRRAFRQITKLTIVRNPWDLMVSSYEWWRQKAHRFPILSERSERVQRMSFAEFLRCDVGSNGIAEWPGELRDWYQYRGVDIVGTIVKFEALEREMERFLIAQGVPPSRKIKIPHQNMTVRTDYRQYYNNRDMYRVGERFKYDISRFGYSF